MAGEWMKVMLLMFCINGMMYIGLAQTDSFLIEGDLFSNYIDFSLASGLTHEEAMLSPGSSTNITFTEGVIDVPEKESSASIPGVAAVSSFIDGLNQAYAFIKLMINVAFAPLTLFTLAGIPFFIKILMVPMVILYAASIIRFIRGA